ncbi:MAG TPA: tape measure protein [Clostridiaceae bacterium]|nr:tape measure protein [Clostridiaceae bacterium]
MADGSITIEVELTKEQIEQGLKSLKTDLDSLSKSSKSIDKISNGFNSVGKVASKTGNALTVGLTTPLIALGTAGVKYNAQMEDFQANLTTLLGSADKASEMLNTLKQMANTTPFETSDLLQATQMMLGFGLQADKTTGYLQTLGDISMGNSEKLMSLTRAFSQIGASGKATMEDINQMIDAGFNPLQIISEQTGQSMATLRDEVSKGNVSFEDIANAMQVATSEGGRYYQAMDKASQTMNGKMSTAMDALKTALGNVTQSLLPIVTKVVEKVTEWANAFANLDQGTQETILKIAGIVAAAGPVLKIIGGISSGIGKLIDVGGKIGKAFTTGSKAVKLLGSAFSFLTSPIGIVIAIIGAIVGVIVYLWNTNEGFRNAIISAWQAICNFFSSIPAFFQGLWETIKNFFINGWNSIVAFFTETIPAWIQSIITWFQQLPYNIGLLIGQILGHIIQFGVNAWNWVTTELPKIILGIVQWFMELPGRIWNWLLETVEKINQWGVEMWNKATTAVSNMINSVVNWFKELPGRIWNWLVETVVKVNQWGIDMINKGKQAAGDLVTNIVDTIKNLPSKMLEIGKNIVQGIWDGITGMVSWLKDKISGFLGGIVDGVKGVLGIHSPSKVFNKEVGRFMAMGIGEGFEDNLDKVYRQMQSAVDFETQKLSANLSTTATNNKLFTANILMKPSDIYLDSTKVGRAVTPAVTKTLRGAGAY